MTSDVLTPFERYARLRDDATVHREHDPAFGMDVWVVARYEDVRTALADRRLTNEAEAFDRARRRAGAADGAPPWDHEDEDLARRPKRNLLKTGPEEHARLRNLVVREFSPRRMESLRPKIQRFTDQLLDTLASRDTIEVQHDFALPLSIMVICDLLGLPYDEVRRFAIPQGTREDVYELRRYLLGHICGVRPTVDLGAERESQPDVVRSLIVARDQDGSALDDQELLDMVEILLIAGEAPVAVIGNGVHALLEQPEILDRIREDPGLVPAAVEELLRFEGGDDHVRYRVTREEIAIGSARIPQGDIVKLILASANRDPRRFDDPDHLDLEREVRHVAFGRGMHVCLGAPLARLECQIALATLIRRFPAMSLAIGPEDSGWESHGPDGRQLSRVAVPVRLGRASG